MVDALYKRSYTICNGKVIVVEIVGADGELHVECYFKKHPNYKYCFTYSDLKSAYYKEIDIVNYDDKNYVYSCLMEMIL